MIPHVASEANVMNNLFGELRSQRSKALAPFFTAGYPSFQASESFAGLAADCGADFVEIGMAFSDPLADGPSIQYSSQVALDNGFNFAEMFKSLEKVSKQLSVPIMLMGYTNPMIAHGLESFVRKVSLSGAAGLIIPDLPPEEADELRAVCDKYNVALTFLVAPTSSKQRVKLIDAASTDFVYAVTVAGVTGARKEYDSKVESYLKRLRKELRKPFVAGFGVSNPETARTLAKYSDGVVVGSALVELIRQNPKSANTGLESFMKSLRKAVDSAAKE